MVQRIQEYATFVFLHKFKILIQGTWHISTARNLKGAAKKWTPKVFRRFLSNRLKL